MSRRSIKKTHCQAKICTRDVSLQQTVCSIFVLPELMLSFVHGISSWSLLLLLFRKWPYSVPACLWFDCQLSLGLQHVCCLSRWSVRQGTMITAHAESPGWASRARGRDRRDGLRGREAVVRTPCDCDNENHTYPWSRPGARETCSHDGSRTGQEREQQGEKGDGQHCSPGTPLSVWKGEGGRRA